MSRNPDDHTYFTYIMASLSGTLYVGMTNALVRRVRQHKSGESDFTGRYKVDRLVYFERFQYVRNAIAREKQIKGWKREKKIALIESTNPAWRDLSKDFGKPVVLKNPVMLSAAKHPYEQQCPVVIGMLRRFAPQHDKSAECWVIQCRA